MIISELKFKYTYLGPIMTSMNYHIHLFGPLMYFFVIRVEHHNSTAADR